jgi:hypothetical protein
MLTTDRNHYDRPRQLDRILDYGPVKMGFTSIVASLSIIESDDYLSILETGTRLRLARSSDKTA